MEQWPIAPGSAEKGFIPHLNPCISIQEFPKLADLLRSPHSKAYSIFVFFWRPSSMKPCELPSAPVVSRV